MSEALSLRQTIYVAIRSAVSAIAFIAIFDRQYRLSEWLHWIIWNYKGALHAIFSQLPFHVPQESRPPVAFLLIIMGTVLASFVTQEKYSIDNSSEETAKWRMRALLLLGLLTAILIFFPPADQGFLLIVFLFYALATLVVSIAASPRMFLWLAVFVAIFVGINEFAIAFQGAVPPPPPTS